MSNKGEYCSRQEDGHDTDFCGWRVAEEQIAALTQQLAEAQAITKEAVQGIQEWEATDVENEERIAQLEAQVAQYQKVNEAAGINTKGDSGFLAVGQQLIDLEREVDTLARHLDEANTEIRRLKSQMGRPSSGWRMPSEGGK